MIDLLFACPAFIKVGIIFLLILISSRAGMSLGVSITLFSSLLTLWSGAGLSGLIAQFGSLVHLQSILLIVVIFSLLFFTEVLNKTGRMEKTVSALKQWCSSYKLIISGVPALIGLLPMPGGALFSAPFVSSADSEKKLSPSYKTAVNFWFRHIWEYWWPLYPGVVLAIAISGISPGVFYLLMMPLTIAAIAGGYFFLLRKAVKGHINKTNRVLNRKDISATIYPISILVFFSVLGTLIIPEHIISSNISNLISMLAGLIFALVPVICSREINFFIPSLKSLLSKKTFSIMFVIIGVLLFSAALKLPINNTGKTIVSIMRDEFRDIGIPVILIIMILPFISGIITGVSVGFVGASFPLIFEIIGSEPSFNIVIATTVLSYTSGFIGILLSPVHICLVVTNEYFKSGILPVLKLILLPSCVVLCVALFMSALYYYIF